jgi:tRNA pseudouridine55 synthase
VPAPGRGAVEAALERFRGPIQQVPPDHSAVHVDGRRAYELARGGERPKLSPRDVIIHELELTDWDTGDPERPMAELDVRCSAGTYVRSLARDLGGALGCGAYLGALTRTASGPFRLEDAHPLDELRTRLAGGDIGPLLLPADAGLDHLPVLRIPDRDRMSIARGQIVRVRGQVEGPVDPAVVLQGADDVRVRDERGLLVAMGHTREGRLYPDKVFIAPEASS